LHLLIRFIYSINSSTRYGKTARGKFAAKNTPTGEDIVAGGGQWRGYGGPHFTAAGSGQLAAGSNNFFLSAAR